MTSSTPIFACADIDATIAFYKDVLGFESSWTIGEPPTYGAVTLGAVMIMFSLDPDLTARGRGHQHWFNVEDTDALCALHIERGAKIASPIEDKPWGFREYTVEDPNGYHLRFAGPVTGSVKPSSPLPDGVTVERRLPTLEEYQAISGPAFYQEGVSSECLEGSWGGVVAVTPSGQAVGMVRIMCDAPGWFSVWDVAVLPEWQGKSIGRTLMQEALSIVRDASPGAWVYLFTYKHGFYEKVGFGKQTVSMRRV